MVRPTMASPPPPARTGAGPGVTARRYPARSSSAPSGVSTCSTALPCRCVVISPASRSTDACWLAAASEMPTRPGELGGRAPFGDGAQHRGPVPAHQRGQRRAPGPGVTPQVTLLHPDTGRRQHQPGHRGRVVRVLMQAGDLAHEHRGHQRDAPPVQRHVVVGGHQHLEHRWPPADPLALQRGQQPVRAARRQRPEAGHVLGVQAGVDPGPVRLDQYLVGGHGRRGELEPGLAALGHRPHRRRAACAPDR